jgi:hypothetical protein
LLCGFDRREEEKEKEEEGLKLASGHKRWRVRFNELLQEWQ